MTDTLTLEALAEMRKLLAKATPGPWVAEECGEKHSCIEIGTAIAEDDTALSGWINSYDKDGNTREGLVLSLIADLESHNVAGISARADADIILALRNNAPALLTLAERAIEGDGVRDAKLAQLRKQMDAGRWPIQTWDESYQKDKPAAERPVEEIAEEIGRGTEVFRPLPTEIIEETAAALRTERERTKAAEAEWNELHRLFVNLSRDHTPSTKEG